MPPGPASPASMPTIRNTSSSGAPNRIATRLDMMPASTSSAPSRMPILMVSSEAMVRESSSPLVMRTRRAATDKYGPPPRVMGRAVTGRGFQSSSTAPGPPATAAGIACGAGAALFWAAGFVAARHGIAIGFSPADIAFHRFVWAGLVFLPFVARAGLRDLGGVGWAKGVALTLLSGPPIAFLSYAGFLFVPLAHGGVIQPSCATLGGLALATLVLKEKLPARRAAGAAVIVAGLAVIGADALVTIGT